MAAVSDGAKLQGDSASQLIEWLKMGGMIVLVAIVAGTAVSWMWSSSWKPWLDRKYGDAQEEQEEAEEEEGKPATTPLVGDRRNSPPPPGIDEPLSQPRCEPAEVLRTMGTQWLPEERFLGGKSAVVTNTFPSAVFLDIKVPRSGERQLTALVMPNESIRLPLVGLAAEVTMTRGRQWCNRKVGWMDGEATKAKQLMQVAKFQKETTLNVVPGGAEGKPALIPATQTRTAGVPHGAIVEHAGADRASDKLTFTAPATKKPLGRTEPLEFAVPRRRGPDPAEEETFRQGVPPEQRLSVGPQRAHETRTAFETVELPRRDIRVQANGKRFFVGGEVNGSETNFMIDHHSELTAVPEGVMDSVDLQTCRKRTWYIMGLIREGCAVKTESLRIGSLEVEGIWVAVVPELKTSVLGRNLIGKARFKRGPDGMYLSVGQ